MVKQRLGRKVRFREWGRDRVERDKNRVVRKPGKEGSFMLHKGVGALC